TVSAPRSVTEVVVQAAVVGCGLASATTLHVLATDACDDGVFCNGVETCDPSRGCVAGAAPVCDDGVACTVDRCDADADACAHAASDLLCGDANACTDDTCDATLGCVYSNNTAPCDDGDACTTGESCRSGVCGAGTPRVCDDANTCTDDACDPLFGCV